MIIAAFFFILLFAAPFGYMFYKFCDCALIVGTGENEVRFCLYGVLRIGRTSSEIVRKRSYVEELNEMGDIVLVEEQQEEPVHEEFLVLDRSGRVQLPKEFLESLGIKGGEKIKAELDAENDRVVLFRSGS